MRSAPREGWILAGTIDGAASAPALTNDVAGVAAVVRTACELALAGATTVFVVWTGAGALPDLSAFAADPRLAGRARLEVVAQAPAGADDDGVIVARADRVFHRDIPGAAVLAWRNGTARLGKVAGDVHDAVFAVDRATARRLAAAAPRAGGLPAMMAELIAAGEVAVSAPPYLAFTAAAADRKGLRRAERRLVWSLRKSADGIAATLLNRHLSLPITWLLRRTKVTPNQVTVVAFLCALAGGLVLAQGGYRAGVAGLLLVEAGSIIDGIDGELARLRFQFSRLGQWLDTVADDAANVAYVSGVAINLHAAGVTWAAPLAITALAAFAITQATQYYLITAIYRSGDLAAIPWAFQSSAFLSQRPSGFRAWLKATAPKLGKRDFAVTMFVVFALLGHLELILLAFAAGALSFFVAFWIQCYRNRASIRAARDRAR